ncbi:NADH-quinone oxidoreductase subunit NuoG [Coralloluteibacterium thermophilus]|uniref:NADH-quinone oxidoreductase subunit G n=1 Tax=Coralloluteibacterium thermophilum TaxID=2707049 RepID=A0ABV9NFF3_9GAMM
MSAQPANPNTPPDHVNIEINGVALTAPKGSMIIQAADKAGIPIPRFCYHERLPIAANCRMCLVEVEKAPKPMPACATPVMEGMKVVTRSEKALSAQRNVMEFLLINHPLDCPICDQGGECELQDVSLGYGRSVSRYAERKRVVADEDLGPLVATEMTRCIHCTRCIRVMNDVAATYELGGMNRGERLEIGTYDGKPLMSELSGNVIDVCPVGALTNKVFRFRARPWELIARESIGYHDALGSNLYLHARRGEVMRTVPRDNDAINECWLSDRDRFSHQGLYAADRAMVPMVRKGDAWQEVEWDEALAAAARILRENAGDALGVLAHPATSNEEGSLLRALADALGTGSIDHRINLLDLADRPVAEPGQVRIEELEQADVVLIVGSNPRHEVPLLHHRLRKAVKRGAKIATINPVDFDFTFAADVARIVAPSKLPAELESLAPGDAIHDLLANAGNAVILLGALAETHPRASRIRSVARRLAAATGARLNRIPQGANAVGLARHGVLPTALDARAMLAQPRRAYVLYGIEPGQDFADNAAAREALAGAKVVAFSHFACASTRAVADVILPIGLTPEIEATYTNMDGVDQRVVPGGKLPGAIRAGWRVLRALGGELGAAGFEFVDMAGLRAQMKADAVRPGEGEAPADAPVAGDTLERIASPGIYRVDAVLRRAPALQAHPLTTGPRAVLHPEDALARGLSEGAIAKVGDARGTATVPVHVSTRVARGAVWIETGYAETAPLSAAGALTVTRA